MCTPRVEGDSSALPSTIVSELGVVDGHVYAGLTHRPNVDVPAAFPLVRFETGKPVTVLADRGMNCSDNRVECLRADGRTIFVGTAAGEALRFKRFSADGTASRDVVAPDDGYRLPQMSADDGRLLLRGTVGPMAVIGEDGRATRLTELRYAAWPVLSGADAFLANQDAVERVGLDGAVSTMGTIPRGKIVSIAAGKAALFALARSTDGTEATTLYRFPRTGRQVAPDVAASLAAEAIQALNEATIDVPGATARAIDERPVELDGRFYFTMMVSAPDRSQSARVIVEWSEARGFRPFATVVVPLGETRAVRLEASNGRLYWIEQPMEGNGAGPPWRIVSSPL